MKIKHYIKEVNPNIFAVVVKNKYDRAMLFCRAQEYYESPSPKFRGKEFSIWDYMKWYDEQNGWGFSYGADWSGFNIPLKQINDCYNKLNKFESPYDKIMHDILSVLNLKYLSKNGYVIGCGDTKGDTFKHEVCHGLYYTNKEYKKKMDALTKKLPKQIYNTFKKNILALGYASKVVDDEIQAYLQYGYQNPDFGRGVDIDVRIKYSNLYHQQAKI
jgi:hypothetical protein